MQFNCQNNITAVWSETGEVHDALRCVPVRVLMSKPWLHSSLELCVPHSALSVQTRVEQSLGQNNQAVERLILLSRQKQAAVRGRSGAQDGGNEKNQT